MKSALNKQLLFITTSNLSTNPRILKEIEFALNEKYIVNIICFKYNGWSENLDIIWLIKHPDVTILKISAQRSPFFPWLQSSLLEWISKKLYLLADKKLSICAFALSKRSYLIEKYLSYYSTLDNNINLVIAHNLGALYPAWKYSKQKKIPFIFDLEDYHPGEYVSQNNKIIIKQREYLLKKLLPQAVCVTAASPNIAERTKLLLNKEIIRRMLIVNNCFPSDEFIFNNIKIPNQIQELSAHSLSSNLIHFVWFSQNIASNRGLELIIPELAKQKDKIHLHLIGHLYPEFEKFWITPNLDFISVYQPKSQKDLNHFICQFDVGLAIEPGKDENNLIALSNKIWCYLQAGLFILATDTIAQVNFLKEHQNHGIIFKGKEHQKYNISLLESVNYILNNIEHLRQTKYERFINAKRFAWEEEKEKIRNLWQSILKY